MLTQESLEYHKKLISNGFISSLISWIITKHNDFLAGNNLKFNLVYIKIEIDSLKCHLIIHTVRKNQLIYVKHF